MSPILITGALTALATPFGRDGSLALDDLERLVEDQIANGIDGLLPVGTTGESPTLDHQEHHAVIDAVIAAARGRVPVIAGAGSNSTKEAVSLARHAHEAGADGILQVAPYYNKPTQEGLFRHFAAVAEATDKPVVLYSIPSRCGVEIAVETVERLLSKFPHVNHIKEAGGSVDRVDQLATALGDDLVVLSGDDSLTLPFMALGANGVISVASNALPAQIKALADAANRGDLGEATRWHRALYPIFKGLFLEPNPVPVKACLKRRGLFACDDVRLPLAPMDPDNRAAVLALYEAAASLQKMPTPKSEF